MNLQTKKKKMTLLLALLALTLSACSGNDGGNAAKVDDQPPAVSDEAPAAETPAETPADQPAEQQPAEQPAQEPADVPSVSDLPETKDLDIVLEGNPEKVPAKLTKSDLGYAFYMMDNFEFTPEEPGKDMIFNSNFPEYYTRVEMLPGDVNIDEIKANAETQLKAVGDVIEMKGEEIHASVRDQAKFFLHAGTSELSRNMVLIENNGALFLFTMNFPNGEASEGVAPRFFPMIASVVPVK